MNGCFLFVFGCCTVALPRMHGFQWAPTCYAAHSLRCNCLDFIIKVTNSVSKTSSKSKLSESYKSINTTHLFKHIKK